MVISHTMNAFSMDGGDIDYSFTRNFKITFSYSFAITRSVQTFGPIILIYTAGMSLFIIIGDVHIFIVYCLIP